MVVRAVLVVVFGVAGCGRLATSEAPQAAKVDPMKQVKLVAIGNSFSFNATRDLGSIAKAAGCRLVLGQACINGCSLKTHWDCADLAEREPANPKSKPYVYKGRCVSLKDMLVAESWDVVTLQQHSMDGCQVASFRPYAKNLRDYVRRYAPRAKVVVQETWAYRGDDPAFVRGFSQKKMLSRLRANYDLVAGELGAEVIPVGDAFENARLDPDWKADFPDPHFDCAHARYPALPQQSHSLNVGYAWTKDKQGWHLAYDGHHANVNGEYLAAAVWFEFLWGRNVIGNAYLPKSMTVGEAGILQRIAHQTVAERRCIR